MIKPPQLLSGDKVMAVTLSWGGPGTFPHRYEAGKRQIEEALQLELVAAPHARHDADWIARHPEARANDLMMAFADPTCRGIISTIGGDDSIRLLPHLDLDLMRRNPKVFLGYSDTTIAHFACFRAGLVSFYGPSITAGFAENGGMHDYLLHSLRRALFDPSPIGQLVPNVAGWTHQHLDWADPSNQAIRRTLQPSTGWRFLQGDAPVTGVLLGGCLEVLEFLKGTPFWPPDDAWNGAVLFLETSEEGIPPVRVVRFLRNFMAQGLLSRLGGILFGRPGGVPATDHAAFDQALLQGITEEADLGHLPVVSGLDFGHTDPMMVLPMGIPCRIDPAGKTVSIEAAGVCPRELLP